MMGNFNILIIHKTEFIKLTAEGASLAINPHDT
jgi:hypothetical protein